MVPLLGAELAAGPCLCHGTFSGGVSTSLPALVTTPHFPLRGASALTRGSHNFPPAVGSGHPAGPLSLGAGGGAREQRPLCALAPGAALYELQALPSLQPSSGQSHSLGGGTTLLPSPSLAVPVRGGQRGQAGGQDGEGCRGPPSPARRLSPFQWGQRGGLQLTHPTASLCRTAPCPGSRASRRRASSVATGATRSSLC